MQSQAPAANVSTSVVETHANASTTGAAANMSTSAVYFSHQVRRSLSCSGSPGPPLASNTEEQA